MYFIGSILFVVSALVLLVIYRRRPFWPLAIIALAWFPVDSAIARDLAARQVIEAKRLTGPASEDFVAGVDAVSDALAPRARLSLIASLGLAAISLTLATRRWPGTSSSPTP